MKLLKNRVYDVSFECRILDPRDGAETGEFRGYWTGEIDTWGKYTFIVISDHINPIYLFRDEFTVSNPQGDN